MADKKQQSKSAQTTAQTPDEPKTAVQPEPEKQPTEAELMAQLESAFKQGDYKLIATISRKIDQLERAKEKAEADAKVAVLKVLGDKVGGSIMVAVQPLIDSGELDKADGIWFSYDFGEKTPVVRLMKTAQKAVRTGGGGTGKKFDVSTETLLEKYGTQEYKDGMTFQQAYESSTDKNWRYGIRTKLLKLEGII